MQAALLKLFGVVLVGAVVVALAGGATNVVNKHILTAQQDVARCANSKKQQQQQQQQSDHLHMLHVASNPWADPSHSIFPSLFLSLFFSPSISLHSRLAFSIAIACLGMRQSQLLSVGLLLLLWLSHKHLQQQEQSANPSGHCFWKYFMHFNKHRSAFNEMESARSLCTQSRRVVFVVVSSLLCSTNCSIMSSGMPWPHLFSNCISLFYVNSAPHECVWFLCRCVLVSMPLPSGHTAFMHSDTSCAEHTQCCGKVVPVRRHLSCSVS